MRGKRFGALAVCLAAALLTAGIPPVPARAAGKDLQSQLSQLEKEEASLRRQAEQTRKNLSEQQAHLDNLNRQIANLNDQIALLDEQMDTLAAGIAEKNAGISQAQAAAGEKEKEIASKKEALSGKLRAMSKFGNYRSMQLLANTANYTDYLIKSKALSRIAEKDEAAMRDMEDVIGALQREKDALEAARQAITDKQAQTAALRSAADQKKEDMDTLYKEVRQVIRKMEQDQEVLNRNLKENQRMQADLDRRIAELNKAPSAAGAYKSGSMYWPVPTVHTLSSPYGIRDNVLHKGIDIANHPTIKVYGQNIVAASDGVVLLAYTRDKTGGGYGYHIIVDHGVDAGGKRITTLYAHCSKVFVTQGQRVTGGQTVLGQAGNTGRVTGPHLHFEVRENNVAVDPIKKGYVKP